MRHEDNRTRLEITAGGGIVIVLVAFFLFNAIAAIASPDAPSSDYESCMDLCYAKTPLFKTDVFISCIEICKEVRSCDSNSEGMEA